MKVHATATRSGKWWALQVTGQYEVATQARHLKDAAAMVADAVATLYDLNAADVDVEVDTTLPPDLAAAVKVSEDAAAASRRAFEQASNAQRDAARALLGSGLPMRDAAEVLGVSHQRVGQIVKG